jgi:threonine dehydrogenase-like Zn-dependent dehydrogenase
VKAAVYYRTGAPDVLRYEDVDDPTLGPGEVLVKVEAISIEGGDTLNRLGGEMASTPPGVFLGAELFMGDRARANIARLLNEVATGDRQVVVDRAFALSEAPPRPTLTWRTAGLSAGSSLSRKGWPTDA